MTLYSATLSGHDDNLIQVHIPARAAAHKRLSEIDGAWFDTATLRWYCPLSQAAALWSAVPVLVLSDTLRKRLEQTP